MYDNEFRLIILLLGFFIIMVVLILCLFSTILSLIDNKRGSPISVVQYDSDAL